MANPFPARTRFADKASGDRRPRWRMRLSPTVTILANRFARGREKVKEFWKSGTIAHHGRPCAARVGLESKNKDLWRLAVT
jgi:hypothetical protein